MSVSIPFVKMVGTGNDFLIVDTLRHKLGALTTRWSRVARAMCDRRYGVGADGLLVLESSRVGDVKMRVFNPDGSEAEMCGNGSRCVALYVSKQQKTNGVAPVTIESRAGLLSARLRGTRVALRMTDPTEITLSLAVNVHGRRIRVGVVNTGVPHVVVPVKAVDRIDVNRVGRALRNHQVFAPRGTNVNFIQADPRHANRLRVRTYERGVEEETLACGTGIVASAIVYALTRTPTSTGCRTGARTQAWRLDVQPRSGEVLTVSFAVTAHGCTPQVRDVMLEGAARRICEGTVDWPMRSHEATTYGAKRT
jgi:diaminopimelate epimerase